MERWRPGNLKMAGKEEILRDLFQNNLTLQARPIC